jgi:predicted O-methyltransferase YrrM
MKQVFDYIKFRLKSVNAHGLHSPFMYHLATRCFYDKKKYSEYKKLKSYHHQLLKNKEFVSVTDLGAGSKKMKNNRRQIRQIAQISGSSYNDMKLLFRISRYFKPKNILELGTSLGKSAFALSVGNPDSSIISVEGDATLAAFSQAQLQQNKIDNIQIIHSDFDIFLDKINKTNRLFDMILIDGNHRLLPTLRYFEKLLPHIHNDTVVIIDDIYWSNEMKQAWSKLITHPAVRQSVNSFYFGLLFFRKEQFKQNFMIRI